MANENFFTDNPDILFHLKRRVDWEAVYAWLSDEEKEAVNTKNAQEYLNGSLEALETLGEICGGPIAANAEAIDRSEFKLIDGREAPAEPLRQNMEILKEFGLPAFGVAPQYGGLGATMLIEMAGAEILNRACPSTMLNASWYGNIAHIIELYGSEELKNTYIPKIAEGLYSGNMALTEPDAGSDLGALRTYGIKQDDGTWRLYGTKRFISNGPSEISLVLAKNEKGSAGLEALSLFLCPRTIDGEENIKVTKLEEKVALHGSATAELAYDGSRAWLLGEEGEGFRYMLRLMNDSRIGVAFQGVGAMEATWRLAASYASERKTWGKPIAQHELIAAMLLDLEVELKAIRSLSYQAAFNRTMVSLGERRLKRGDLSAKERKELEKQVGKYQARVRRWTPLIKYWVGENAILHARTAMQILGGYGFTREYRAEWWVRESLIYSIYEGTSQIQALMCIKDSLKEVVRDPRHFIEVALGLKVKSIAQGDSLKKRLYKLKQLTHSAIVSVLFKLLKTNARASYSANSDADLLKLIKTLSKDLVKFEHLSPALLHAERICEMKCLTALAEALIWDAATEPDRRWVAERFMYKALPRMQYLKAMIDQDDPVLESTLKAYEQASSATAATGTHGD